MTERVSVDKPAAAGDEEPEPQDPVCGSCGKYHDELTSKERSWWVLTALGNCGLVIVPLMPALDAWREFTRPSADVKLTDAQRDAVNSVFHVDGPASEVRRVTVILDHPSIWERLMAAGPSLLLTLMLLTVAWSLWRIEVNMTAGPHQRPFTEKDERVLTRVSRSLWWWWIVFVVVEAIGLTALAFGDKGTYFGPISDVTLVILGLVLLVGSFARVYRKGRAAYTSLEKAKEDLEKIV